jgi:uncharacterized Zn-binding protein involved in type VI secretion
MIKIARHGDICGGAIIATATKTFVNGKKVARIGDRVTSHGTGGHSGAVMIEGSTDVFAEGIGVCRYGDAASCGHRVTTTSPDTYAD